MGELYQLLQVFSTFKYLVQNYNILKAQQKRKDTKVH